MRRRAPASNICVDGAQILERGGFSPRVLAGAIEHGQRLDEAHARILRLEFHRFIDARADAPADRTATELISRPASVQAVASA